MKENELRIGNWIIDQEADPNKTIYWQVEEICDGGVKFRNGSCWTIFEYIEPILITEEWLVKFGFEKIVDINTWSYRIEINYHSGYYDYLHIQNIGNKDTLIVQVEIRTNYKSFYLFNPNYKHVHELQNLYFALTGKELSL